MGNQWFYSRGGTRSGPVTPQELKLLAGSGQILPTDLLWRQGLAGWVRAEKLRGLFSENVETSSVPPPLALPEERRNVTAQAADEIKPEVNGVVATPIDSVPSTAGEMVPSVEPVAVNGSETRRTFETVQADRTQLVTTALPAAHRELGEYLQTTGGYASDFPDLYRHLKHLTNSLESFDSENGNGHAATDGEGKTVVPGHRKRTPAQLQSLRLKVTQVQQQLGEAAFAKHGEASGPADLIRHITKTREQISAIDGEIGKLSKLKRNPLRSVKKLLYGGVFAILLVVIAYVHFAGKSAMAGIAR